MAFIDDNKKVSDMSSQELIELMFAKQVDREMIWFMIKVKFTP